MKDVVDRPEELEECKNVPEHLKPLYSETTSRHTNIGYYAIRQMSFPRMRKLEVRGDLECLAVNGEPGHFEFVLTVKAYFQDAQIHHASLGINSNTYARVFSMQTNNPKLANQAYEWLISQLTDKVNQVSWHTCQDSQTEPLSFLSWEKEAAPCKPIYDYWAPQEKEKKE